MFAGAREAEESRGSSGRQVRTGRPCSQTPCCYHHSTEKIHKRTRRQHNTASHRQHRHNPRSVIHYMAFFFLLAVRCKLLDYCSSVFGEVVVMCMLCNVILPNNCRYFDACKASNETCLVLPYISLYFPPGGWSTHRSWCLANPFKKNQIWISHLPCGLNTSQILAYSISFLHTLLVRAYFSKSHL